MIKKINVPDGGLVSHWQSPSNIALVKYWGKRDNQVPQNASLSITLSNALTQTRIELLTGQFNNNSFELDFTFEGQRNPVFADRLKSFLKLKTQKELLP